MVLLSQVCVIGDSVGSILAYDALCRNVKRSASDGSVADADISPGSTARALATTLF